MSKADYVRSQGQTRDHHCHWPGCEKQVPPAMWGCKAHWFSLPKVLRDTIWNEYRPGQEKNGTPSLRYLVTAHLVQEWIEGRIEIRSDGSVHAVTANAAAPKPPGTKAMTEDHNPYDAGSTPWSRRNQRGFGWDVNPWVWVIEFKKELP